MNGKARLQNKANTLLKQLKFTDTFAPLKSTIHFNIFGDIILSVIVKEHALFQELFEFFLWPIHELG